MDTFILPPEIIFDILINLPYRDLQNTCRSNRQYGEICSAPNFWRRKIYHDFGIVYDSTNYLNLKEREFYEYLLSQNDTFPGCEKYNDINICLVRAVKQRNIPLIKYFLDNKGSLTRALKTAVEIGDVYMADYLISQGADPKSILIKYLDNSKTLKEADPDIFNIHYFNQVRYTEQPIVFPQSMLEWIDDNVNTGQYPYNILVYRGNMYMAPKYTEYKQIGLNDVLESPMSVDLKNIQIYDDVKKSPFIRRIKSGDVRGISYITWD